MTKKKRAIFISYHDKWANNSAISCDPEAADALLAAGAGCCFNGALEMREASPGSNKHGCIEECEDHSGIFFRIWNDTEGTWLNSYA